MKTCWSLRMSSTSWHISSIPKAMLFIRAERSSKVVQKFLCWCRGGCGSPSSCSSSWGCAGASSSSMTMLSQNSSLSTSFWMGSSPEVDAPPSSFTYSPSTLACCRCYWRPWSWREMRRWPFAPCPGRLGRIEPWGISHRVGMLSFGSDTSTYGWEWGITSWFFDRQVFFKGCRWHRMKAQYGGQLVEECWWPPLAKTHVPFWWYHRPSSGFWV